MNIKINVKGARELNRKLLTLQKNIPSAGFKSVKETMVHGKRIAQAMAPVKKGHLRRGIRYRVKKTKKGAEGVLSSSVNKEFPYNLWVNRNIRTIRGRHPWFGSKGKKVMYGGMAKSPAGNPIQWTGVPGFFPPADSHAENPFQTGCPEA